MEKAYELYVEIGATMSDAKAGNMFGWQCIKYKNKPFLFFDKKSESAMIFKLDKDSIIDALDISGSETFNPGDKGKPMKNWVLLPFKQRGIWKDYALKSYHHILKEVENGKR